MGAVKNHYHDAICAEEHDDPISTCGTCEGRGEIGGFDHAECAYRTERCPECDGHGVINSRIVKEA